MTSIHHPQHTLPQRHPSGDQARELVGLSRMLTSNVCQQHRLGSEQFQVGNRQVSRLHHGRIAGQGMAAENNAIVGCGWGHGGDNAGMMVAVNDGTAAVVAKAEGQS